MEDEPGLDGLSETDIIGDEEVRAGELERLHQRRELMRHQLDARAERSLKTRRIGGAHGAPLESVEIRAEMLRRIERVDSSEPLHRRREDARAELKIPEHFKDAPRGVVIEAGEPNAGGFARGAFHDLFDEPMAVADAHDIARRRETVCARRSRRLERFDLDPRGFEETNLKIAAGSTFVSDAMGAAGREVDGNDGEATSGLPELARSLWPWLAGAVVVASLAEWWWDARRR